MKQTEHIKIQISSVSVNSELTAEYEPRCWEPNCPSESPEERQEMEIIEQECKKTEQQETGRGKDKTNNSTSDLFNGKESDEKEEDNTDVCKMTESEPVDKKIEPRVKDDSNEAQDTGSDHMEHSIQVMNGDLVLGSVQWRDWQPETAKRIQVENTGALLFHLCSCSHVAVVPNPCSRPKMKR